MNFSEALQKQQSWTEKKRERKRGLIVMACAISRALSRPSHTIYCYKLYVPTRLFMTGVGGTAGVSNLIPP